MRPFLLRATLVFALLWGVAACNNEDHAASAASYASSQSAARAAASAATLANVPSAGPPTAPGAPTGEVVSVPSTIDSACGSDVTEALEDFMRTVPSNSTVMFPANGCYQVNGTLTLDKYNKATIDGQGTTITASTDGDRNRRHLVLSNANDVTIRNLTVVGANPRPGTYTAERAFQHGFELESVHRVVLENVAANRVYGDFVYIGGGQGKPSTDVAVNSSRFDGSGRQGIAVTDAERVLIKDNHIANTGRSLIDIETNTVENRAKDIRITGNTTGPAVNFWLANKGGDDVGPVEIDGNTMEAPTGGLLFAFGSDRGVRGPYVIRDNHLIANNAVTDEGSSGAFVFAHARDITIAGNDVWFVQPGTMPAVELRSSSKVRVAKNDFDGAKQPVFADDLTADVFVS